MQILRIRFIRASGRILMCDRMFRNRSHSRSHLKAAVLCQIFHFCQCIIVGTVAVNTEQNTRCSISLYSGKPFCGCRWNTAPERWHRKYRHILFCKFLSGKIGSIRHQIHRFRFCSPSLRQFFCCLSRSACRAEQYVYNLHPFFLL